MNLTMDIAESVARLKQTIGSGIAAEDTAVLIQHNHADIATGNRFSIHLTLRIEAHQLDAGGYRATNMRAQQLDKTAFIGREIGTGRRAGQSQRKALDGIG